MGMSIAIKDFEMPSCCGECQMASCKGLSGQFYCDITTYDVDMDDTERDVDCPLVEAISKDQYEARLKVDLKAILVELQLQFEEKGCKDMRDCWWLIEEKINALKENTDGME